MNLTKFGNLQIGGDAYSFDYSKSKIGNLPEVTRIEGCGDHVKQDPPFMGMVGGRCSGGLPKFVPFKRLGPIMFARSNKTKEQLLRYSKAKAAAKKKLDAKKNPAGKSVVLREEKIIIDHDTKKNVNSQSALKQSQKSKALPKAMPRAMTRAMARGGSYSRLEEQTYNYIINANTGKKMYIFGSEGKQYLKNLIKMYKNGF